MVTQDLPVGKSLWIPMEEKERTEVVLFLVKTPQKWIVLQPMLPGILQKIWLLQVWQMRYWCRYPMPLVWPNRWEYM